MIMVYSRPIFNHSISLIKKYKPINKRLGYVFEIYSYLNLLIKRPQKPDSKFVIFGKSRSGSTLLVSLLNSNSQIYCDSEIFSRKVLFPYPFLKVRTLLGGKKVYGFKLLTYHLGDILNLNTSEKKQSFLQFINHQGFKFIYLKRENVLRQVLSNMYAHHRGRFHSTLQANVERREKIYVELQALQEHLYQHEYIDRLIETELLKDIPHFRLSYEKDLGDSRSFKATFKRLADYLSFQFQIPETTLVKVTPKNLDDLIENHKEVEKYLKSHGYERYLEN